MLVQTQLDATWEQLVAAIARFLPRLAACIAILVIGYVLAKVVQRVLTALLRRFGVDRALERGGIRDALARADFDVGDVVPRLVFYVAMLVVLQLAFGVFGPNPVSDLIFRLLAFLPRLLVAIVIIVVATVVGSAVRDVVGAVIGGLSYGRALATATYWLIVGIGVFAALDQLEIARTIVTGVFYAALAIVVGVTIVAVGGSGIAPLRQRWERGLTRMEREAIRIRDEARRQREAREFAPQEPEPEEPATEIIADEPEEPATEIIADEPEAPATEIIADEPEAPATEIIADEPEEPATEIVIDEPGEPAAHVVGSEAQPEDLAPAPLEAAAPAAGDDDPESTDEADRTTVEIARPGREPEQADELDLDEITTTVPIDMGRTTTQLTQPDEDDGGRGESRPRRKRRSGRKSESVEERQL